MQIAKNKGLVPKRKKEQRNPRVKHRKKFEKAKIKHKSQVSIYYLMTWLVDYKILPTPSLFTKTGTSCDAGVAPVWWGEDGHKSNPVKKC